MENDSYPYMCGLPPFQDLVCRRLYFTGFRSFLNRWLMGSLRSEGWRENVMVGTSFMAYLPGVAAKF